MVASIAVVTGAGGGIGNALREELESTGSFGRVISFNREQLDLCSEDSIAAAAAALPEGNLRLIINAAGFLHDEAQKPEKSLRRLDADYLLKSFAVNAIGPALLIKHFFPLLPRKGRTVFASLSARVGSIGDNRLGGWYGYRSSKAALNQLVRTAAIELARTHPESICVALHPGTVETKLSEPFVGKEHSAHSPIQSARHLLNVIAALGNEDTGGFFDWRGQEICW